MSLLSRFSLVDFAIVNSYVLFVLGTRSISLRTNIHERHKEIFAGSSAKTS